MNSDNNLSLRQDCEKVLLNIVEATFSRIKHFVVLSTIIYCLGFLYGLVSPLCMIPNLSDEYLKTEITSLLLRHQIEDHSHVFSFSGLLSSIPVQSPRKMLGIYANNARAGFLDIVAAPAFAVLPTIQIFITGTRIGWQAGYLPLFLIDHTHGILEISAAILSAGTGFYLFFTMLQLIFRRTSRAEKTHQCRQLIVDLCVILLLTNLLFLIAASLEAYVATGILRYIINH
ncbi:MAG TPA: hypothetical protein DD435_09735 [Cyanobacteria bacterium UBA8530]|nr:hypothetical protein [Cyanobacteria bacterium UBA8530]